MIDRSQFVPSQSGERRRAWKWSGIPMTIPAVAALVFVLCTGLAVDAIAQAQTPAQTVEIRQVIFGAGGQCRAGSLSSAWVSVYYAGQEPQRARVAWNVPDPDGDMLQVSRELTLNPGANPVWLYGPLDFLTRSGTITEFAVFELDDSGRPQSQLAARNIGMGSVVSAYAGLIGVIGTDSGNLEWYAQPWQPGETQPAAAQEPVQIVRGIVPGSLPDRWMGLDALEALVWVEGNPIDLSLQQAAALEEWVHRGGHFIVVMPQVGDLWTNTPLDAILPPVNVTVWEDQEIAGPQSAGGVLKHLSRDRQPLAPPGPNRRYPRVNLHLFSPARDINGRPTDDWSNTDCKPIMELDVPGPDGTTQRQAVVLRRRVGFGHVTLIGIPVTDPRLRQPPLYWPHTEVFWNPILGRRQDTPNRFEVDQIQQQQRESRELRAVKVRDTVDIGDPFVPMIELSGQAGGGVLLAILLFGLYWVVAGPGVYAWLKSKKMHRHSWLGFVIATGVFTAIGWFGARALRIEGTRPRHVTVYDHIAGTEWQRTTTYLTLMLNGYGSHTVHLVDPAVESDAPDAVATYARHNVVHALYPVHGSLSQFPDTREYGLDAAEPYEIDVPSRNTAKQFVLRWFGRPLEGWGMPAAATVADRPREVTSGPGGSTSQASRVAGVLLHNLPAPLSDITVFYVTSDPAVNPNVQLTRSEGVSRARPPLISYAWSIPQPWQPGQPLDLESETFAYTPDSRFVDGVQDKYMAGMMKGMPHSLVGGQSTFSQTQQRTAMELLGAYHLIKPPIWVGQAPNDQLLYHRSMGRELDMSPWFSQPCLIITGFLRGGEIPTPVRLDGDPLPESDSASLTMIRWVYPL
ncbi:MAG: hypothetical protein HND57_08385 [Planctomycetes bacterium]|nr:hypothetical protein [Planctomycetota bacterium]